MRPAPVESTEPAHFLEWAMRPFVAILCLLAGASMAATNPPPLPPASTPGPAAATKLELIAPEKVEVGSGYIKIVAKGADSIVFDVFGVFEDPAFKPQSDTFGNTLIIGIPAKPGAIRVTAGAIIGGKPVLVSANILVEAKDDASKAEVPKPPPDKPRLHVTVIGLPESAALRKGLEDAGCRYWPYPTLPANRPDLEAQAKKLGVPCIVVQSPDGKIVAAKKIQTEQDVASVVNEIK